MKGLFLNNSKANCSIYESGLMVYQALKNSSEYSLDYIEIDKNNRSIRADYDFYLFNYHVLATKWMNTKSIKKLPGIKITIVLEVAPNDPFVYCPKNDFDSYIVLDPTIKKEGNAFPFPRPIEKRIATINYPENEKPVVGSFGFATKGKGFDLVVEAVSKEFEQAIVKINIPYASYVPDQVTMIKTITDQCKSKAHDGIELIITHDFMEKQDLIEWCSKNTLNCFLYNRNMPGLSATTDQAIASGKPLLVSDCNTFRHIHPYIKPYPLQSIKEAINFTKLEVLKMQSDWSTEKFVEAFIDMLDHFKTIKIDKKDALFKIKKNNLFIKDLRNLLNI